MLRIFLSMGAVGALFSMPVFNSASSACDPPLDPSPITLSSGFNWPHTGPNNTGIFPEMMVEAFCRVGRKVNIVRVPAARSIRQANAGLFFGEGPRRWSLVNQYGHLRLLQPQLYELKFMAFSTRKYDEVQSYSDMVSYSVASVIGRKSVEDNMRAVMENFTLASNETLAFHMLKVGRVDFVVIDELTGLHFAQKAGIKDLYSVELERHAFHLLVHEQNADLMPSLGQALRDMHSDGTIAEITADMINKSYVQSGPKQE